MSHHPKLQNPFCLIASLFINHEECSILDWAQRWCQRPLPNTLTETRAVLGNSLELYWCI